MHVKNTARANRHGGWAKGRDRNEQDPAQTPSAREGHRAASNGLEGNYHEHVWGKSEGANEERVRPRTSP